MVSRDDEISVIWDVRLAFVFRAQQALVQRALHQVDALVSDRADKLRNANLVVARLCFDSDSRLLPSWSGAVNYGQKLAHILNFVEALRRL